ncbi:SixA phosphatase family protein, partial [Escherichia coli]|uniref:SixA phosphatase family protein n=1 Tax=Escherichia coli TaxID=562 RepID=UPI003BA10986
LFRHAKTQRESLTGRDIDRQLSERGEQDAPRMGEEIRDLGLDYDIILSSPAARAVQTAELAGLAPRFDERIYDAPAGRLLAIVQEADDAAG